MAALQPRSPGVLSRCRCSSSNPARKTIRLISNKTGHHVVAPGTQHISAVPTGQLRRRQHSSRLAAGAAAAVAAPVAAAGAASFPALQAAVGPWLPYAMAGAAACCTLLILLVSDVKVVLMHTSKKAEPLETQQQRCVNDAAEMLPAYYTGCTPHAAAASLAMFMIVE